MVIFLSRSALVLAQAALGATGALAPMLAPMLTRELAPELAPTPARTEQSAPTTAHERTVVRVASPIEPAWQDFAFLAALPAAAQLGDGAPIVLAVDADGTRRPEEIDFLRRYGASRVVEIGAASATDAPPNEGVERIDADSADACAAELARRAWTSATRAVVCRDDDVALAACSAVLATRLRAPLVFSTDAGLSQRTRELLETLGVRSACFVGARAAAAKVAPAFAALERLDGAEEVASWMRRHSLPVEYVALSAPVDRARGKVRKLSLAAAALAAGRNGALLPVDLAGATPSTTLDRGARIERTRRALESFRARLDASFEQLCIAAMPEAIPMVPEACGNGIDADPVSDLVYAQTDADPFVELAVGRFIAEDAPSATLLAARSLAYATLAGDAGSAARGDDPKKDEASGSKATNGAGTSVAPWSRTVALAEWEREAEPVFAHAGWRVQRIEPWGSPLAPSSPWTEIGALVHASHSSWLTLGTTYGVDSSTLLAPCIVESGGCSVSSLDEGGERADESGRSVAARLLRNGAIAFAGNTRRAIAESSLYRSELWNALLAGESAGRAHRRALNVLVAAIHDRPEAQRAPYLYELHNVALYGDPALELGAAAKTRHEPARAQLRGNEIVVRAPSEWWTAEVFAPEDWKRDPSQPITTLRGAGVGVESTWNGAANRNEDTLVFTAELRTKRKLRALRPIDAPPAPLGGGATLLVDEHADGSRSIWLRARQVDYDMDAAQIRARADELRWRVE